MVADVLDQARLASFGWVAYRPTLLGPTREKFLAFAQEVAAPLAAAQRARHSPSVRARVRYLPPAEAPLTVSLEEADMVAKVLLQAYRGDVEVVYGTRSLSRTRTKVMRAASLTVCEPDPRRA